MPSCPASTAPRLAPPRPTLPHLSPPCTTPRTCRLDTVLVSVNVCVNVCVSHIEVMHATMPDVVRNMHPPTHLHTPTHHVHLPHTSHPTLIHRTQRTAIPYTVHVVVSSCPSSLPSSPSSPSSSHLVIVLVGEVGTSSPIPLKPVSPVLSPGRSETFSVEGDNVGNITAIKVSVGRTTWVS